VQVVFHVSVKHTLTEMKATGILMVGVGSAAKVMDFPLSVEVIKPEFKLTAADGHELKAHSTLQMETAQPGQRVLQQLQISNVGVVPVEFRFRVNNFDIQPSSGRLQPSEQLPVWVSGIGGSGTAGPAAAAAILTEKCTLSVSGEPSVFNIDLPCAEPAVSFTPADISFSAGLSTEAELRASFISGQLAPVLSQFKVSNTGNMLAKCEFMQSPSLTTVPAALELAPGCQLDVTTKLQLDSLTAVPKDIQLQLVTSSLAVPLITAKCSVKLKAPLLQCEPKTALDFGIIAANITAVQHFQVRNAGTKDLDFAMMLAAELPPGLASLHVSTDGQPVLQPGSHHPGWKLRRGCAIEFAVTVTTTSAPCVWQAAIVLKASKQWELCNTSPWYKRFVHNLKVCTACEQVIALSR